MARIMAIDYGTKRVGIAVTDPMQMIANRLTTVHSKDIFVFLKDYTAKEKVECQGHPHSPPTYSPLTECRAHSVPVGAPHRFETRRIRARPRAPEDSRRAKSNGRPPLYNSAGSQPPLKTTHAARGSGATFSVNLPSHCAFDGDGSLRCFREWPLARSSWLPLRSP